MPIHIALRATALAALLAACSDSKRPEYAHDADTGAAAPATVLTPDPNKSPTDTLPSRTGAPAMAGDTLGAAGHAAGVPGSTPPTQRKGAPRP